MFRAWDLINNRYVPDDFLTSLFLNMNGRLIWYSHSGFEDVTDKFIVESSTGLKDKNRNLIFKGDIVQGDFIDGIWEVFFWEGCFTLKPYSNWTMAHFNCPMSIEIIGNKFQNHELLEKGKS